MTVHLDNREIEALQTELEHFRHERERIRQVLGSVGGKVGTRGERIVNVAFVAGVALISALWVMRNLAHLPIGLPPMVSLEIGVLLVSLKIVWMVQRQTRVDHFQFWILSSIEFRLNALGRQLCAVEDRLRAADLPRNGTERDERPPEEPCA